MDQSVTYTYRRIDAGTSANPSMIEDVLYLEPMDGHERAHRGNLLIVAQFNNPSTAEIDLTKLKETVFNLVCDCYYEHDEIGSPLEALEESINKGIAHAGNLSQEKVQAKLGGLSLWGTTLSYVNLHLLTIGMRRNHEYFELDAPSTGVEEIKNDDLIIAISPTFQESIFKFFLRDKAEVENKIFGDELKSYMGSLNLDEKIPMVIGFNYCTIKPVPGDEEIIEIEYVEDKKKTPSVPNPMFIKFKNLINSILTKLTFRRPNITIYLKKPTVNSRQKKLLFLFALVGVLGVSVYGTLYFKTKQNNTLLVNTSLESAQTNLAKAQDLARLNPIESLALVDVSLKEIGAVKGARQINLEKITELENQAETITQLIYQRTPVVVTEAQLTTDQSKLIVAINEMGLVDNSNTLLVEKDSPWQTPVSVNTYHNNLYVLDRSANAIWKYIFNGGGYNGPSAYLTEPTNLSESLDLAIDGSIYVLSTQAVTKYTLGKKDTYALKGVYPVIESTSRIATFPEGKNIYISNKQGISVFDKNGNYVKTLVGTFTDSVQRLYSLDTDKTLIFQADNRWWQISLLQ